MDLENPATWQALRRVVACLTWDMELREDLFQEALLHLWTLTRRQPKQRISWYLQGCKLHLCNLQRAGRSLDSPKRHRQSRSSPSQPRSLSNPEDFDSHTFDQLEARSSTFAEVSAHDCYVELAQQLPPTEQQILKLLREDFTAREIAHRLGLSHTCVNRHRNRIAARAIRLGITPGASRLPPKI